MNRPAWIQTLHHLNATTGLPDVLERRADLLNLYHAYRALDGVEDVAVPLRPTVLWRLAPYLGLPVTASDSAFPSTLLVSAREPDSVLVAGVRFESSAVAYAISVVGESYATGRSFPPRCLVEAPEGSPRWERTLRLLEIARSSNNTEEVRGAKGFASAVREPADLRNALDDLLNARRVTLSSEVGYAEVRDRTAIGFLLGDLRRDDVDRILLGVEHSKEGVRVGGKIYAQAVVVASIDRAAVMTIRQLVNHPGEWDQAGEWVGEKPLPSPSVSLPGPTVEEVDAHLRAKFSRSESLGSWRRPGYILELQRDGIRVTTFGLTEHESLLQYAERLRDRFEVSQEERAVVVTARKATS